MATLSLDSPCANSFILDISNRETNKYLFKDELQSVTLIQNCIEVSRLYHTPTLATNIPQIHPWKISSQGVKGRSRDFRNVNN